MNDICLSHKFEINLKASYNSEAEKTITNILIKLFPRFTYSSCVFSNQNGSDKYIVGVKYFMFVRDDENDAFNKTIDEIKKVMYDIGLDDIQMFLDGVCK